MKQSKSEKTSAVNNTETMDEVTGNDTMTTLGNIENKDTDELFVFIPFENDP